MISASGSGRSVSITSAINAIGGTGNVDNGGFGGNVTITTAGGGAATITVDAPIDTSGGDDVGFSDFAGNGGTIRIETKGNGSANIDINAALTSVGGVGDDGGRGGNIELITLNGDIFVDGILTSDGGESDNNGGHAGAITVSANGAGRSITITSDINALGGTGNNNEGGEGGNITIRTLGATGAASITILGNLDSSGGNVLNGDDSILAGNAGHIMISTASASAGAANVIINAGITARGGIGNLSTTGNLGGKGGDVTVTTAGAGASISLTGNSTIDTQGGAGNVEGGLGGNVIITTADADIVTNTIITSGGSGNLSTGNGGHGGNVVITAGGDNRSITIGGAISALGGSGNTGGDGGNVTITTTGNASTITVNAPIDTSGGQDPFTNTFGGNGGFIQIQTTGAGGPANIDINASLTSAGGDGFDGGRGGNIELITADGDIFVGGVLTADGGNSDDDGGNAGSITVAANGDGRSITVTSVIRARGGSGNDDDAGDGGNISIRTLGISGSSSITILAGLDASGGSVVNADGNDSGGEGGNITISTVSIDGASILINAAITASGGNGDNAGRAGNVTITTLGGGAFINLTGNSSIDARGGTGNLGDDDDSGGRGGNVAIMTFGPGAPITVSGNIVASGGAGFDGGNGGNITVATIAGGAGSILLDADLISQGGAGAGGGGGRGGNVTVSTAGVDAHITMTGNSEIDTTGGSDSTGNFAGNGGSVLITTGTSGNIIINDITASGGNETGGGNGGDGGYIAITANGAMRNITMIGNVTSDLGAGGGFNGDRGNVDLTANGGFINQAAANLLITGNVVNFISEKGVFQGTDVSGNRVRVDSVGGISAGNDLNMDSGMASGIRVEEVTGNLQIIGQFENGAFNGDIEIFTTDGAITVFTDVLAKGTGNIIIKARGGGNDLRLNANADAATNDGDIFLTGNEDVILNGNVTADRAPDGTIGNVTILADTGNIVQSAGNIIVADVLDMLAAANIGIIGFEPIKTAANTIIANSDTDGNIHIDELDAVVLQSIITADGNIDVETLGIGNMTVVFVQSRDDADDDDIRLFTANGDVLLGLVKVGVGGSFTSAAAGDVVITAGGAGSDIIDINGNVTNVVAHVITMTANSDIGALDDTVLLTNATVDFIEVAAANITATIQRDTTDIALQDVRAPGKTLFVNGLSTPADVVNEAFVWVDSVNGNIDASTGVGIVVDINDHLAFTAPGVINLPAGGLTLDTLRLEGGNVDQAGGNVTSHNTDNFLFKSAVAEMIDDMNAANIDVEITADGNVVYTQTGMKNLNITDIDLAAPDGDGVKTFNGDITVNHVAAANGDITISAQVESDQVDDRIILDTTFGAIIDNHNADVDILGFDLTLNANIGIGSGTGVLGEAAAINTQVVTLVADNSTAGSIQIDEVDDIALDDGAAGTGVVNIGRTVVIDAGGNITDGNDGVIVLTAGTGILRAVNGIGETPGSGAGNIQMNVDTIFAHNTGNNDINLADANTVAIERIINLNGDVYFMAAGNITDDVNDGNADVEAGRAFINSTGGAGNSIGNAGGGGNIDTEVGTLELIGDGGIFVVETAAGGDLILDDWFTGGGVAVDADGTAGGVVNITTLAGDITQSGNIETQGGAVNVTAIGGNIAMDSTEVTNTVSGGGNAQVTYLADNDVLVSLINAGTANITVRADADASTSGAIIDNLAGETANLQGNIATLTAAEGIGDGDDINTELISVSADNSTSGNIEISETAGGGDLNVLLADNTGGAGGNIVITTSAGNLTVVNEGTAADVVTADGPGAITANADTDVFMVDGADMFTDNGAGGIIDIDATNGSVTLGRLFTTNGTAIAVDINAPAGAVIDGGDIGGEDIDANSSGAVVTITGNNGIGSVDPIETQIETLVATNTATGNIIIIETDGLTLQQVLNDGDVGEDIFVESTAGNIEVGNVDANQGNVDGDVSLEAIAGAITDLNGDSTVRGINVKLIAFTGIGDAAANAINTRHAGNLTLAANTQTGDIHVINAGNLIIGSIAADPLTFMVDGANVAVGGVGDDILIRALSPMFINNLVIDNGGGNITLAAEGSTTADRMVINANVTAAGGSGNIDLFAGGNIEQISGNISADGAGQINVNAGVNFNGDFALAVAGHPDADVFMVDGTYAQSGSGLIEVEATRDVFLSLLNTTGNVIVSADDNDFGLADGVGAIFDNRAGEGAGFENIIGDDLFLSAAQGIGSSGGAGGPMLGNIEDIDVNGNTLTGNNTTSGGIQIFEIDDIGIVNVNNPGRNVILDAGGNFTDARAGEGIGSVNITTGNLAIRANNGIGDAGVDDSDIDVDISVLAATTVNGDISIQDVGASNTDLDAFGGITSVTITGATGDEILIRSDDSDLNVQGNVTNDGTGDVTLFADGNATTDDLNVNADVQSTAAGDIFLIAFEDVFINGTSIVSTTGAGTVDVVGGFLHVFGGAPPYTDVGGNADGDVTMADGSQVITAGGDVRLLAKDRIDVARVTAPGGSVFVTADFDNADAGSGDNDIRDNRTSDEAANITAANVTFRAGEGIGSAAANVDDIDVNVSSAAATTATGDISIEDVGATDLAIESLPDHAGANVDGVLISTGGAGDDVLIRNVTGNLDVNQPVTNNGVGSTTLYNADPAADIDLGANVTGNGDIQVIAAEDVDFETGAISVASNGNGNIDILAGFDFNFGGLPTNSGVATGNIDMADGSSVSTGGLGTKIRMYANDDVFLSLADARSGSVLITADADGNFGGMIIDNTALETANIIGSGAALRAGGGIGDSAVGVNVADINTTGNLLDFGLAAVTEDGDIKVTNSGTLAITTVGFSEVTTGVGNMLSGVTVTDGNADDFGDEILIRATSPLRVGAPVTNNGSGPIILTAEGDAAGLADTLTVLAGGNITATGAVAANIDLFASGAINLDDTGVANDIENATNGHINLLAGVDFNAGAPVTSSDGDTAAGDFDITMNAGFVINNTGNGDITLNALDDISLFLLNASGGGNVTVRADFDPTTGAADAFGAAASGNITDNRAGEGGGSENIIGNVVTLLAATGIGSDTGALGDVDDIDMNGNVLNAVNTTSGFIQILEVGNIVIDTVDNGARDIVIDAGGNITDFGNALTDLVAGNAILRAVSGIGSGNAIDTIITNLDARNIGGAANIEITELAAGNDLNITRARNAGDNIIIQTGNGTLTVLDAGNGGVGVFTGNAAGNGDITLTANGTGGTGGDLNINNTVTSGGNPGNVRLTSANGDVNFTIFGDVDTVTNAVVGNVIVSAPEGFITMSSALPGDETIIDAVGQVIMAANNDISLALVRTTNAFQSGGAAGGQDDAVEIVSSSGNIVDINGNADNIIALAGEAELNAFFNIGNLDHTRFLKDPPGDSATADFIEVQVAAIAANVDNEVAGTSGEIAIQDTRVDGSGNLAITALNTPNDAGNVAYVWFDSENNNLDISAIDLAAEFNAVDPNDSLALTASDIDANDDDNVRFAHPTGNIILGNFRIEAPDIIDVTGGGVGGNVTGIGAGNFLAKSDASETFNNMSSANIDVRIRDAGNFLSYENTANIEVTIRDLDMDGQVPVVGLLTNNGNITYHHAGTGNTIIEAAINAGTGNVVLQASGGHFRDDADLGNLDIIGDDLVISANAGIGSDGAVSDGDATITGNNQIETQVNRLAAITTEENIDIFNTGALTIYDARGVTLPDTTAGPNGVIVSFAGAVNNAYVRVVAASPLTVNGNVTNGDGGEIILAANGSTGADDLDINGNITAGNADGHIFLFAGDTIDQDGSTIISADNSGNVVARAGTDYNADGENLNNGTATGNVVQQDGAVIRTDDGVVILQAPGDVLLSLVNADFDADNPGTNNDNVSDVFITANFAGVDGNLDDDDGEIIDNRAGDGDTAENVIADELVMNAASGIGQGTGGLGEAAAIDTDVRLLTALNTNAATTNTQEIQIFETDNVFDNNIFLFDVDNDTRTVVIESDTAILDGNDGVEVLEGGTVRLQAGLDAARGGIGNIPGSATDDIQMDAATILAINNATGVINLRELDTTKADGLAIDTIDNSASATPNAYLTSDIQVTDGGDGNVDVVATRFFFQGDGTVTAGLGTPGGDAIDAEITALELHSASGGANLEQLDSTGTDLFLVDWEPGNPVSTLGAQSVDLAVSGNAGDIRIATLGSDLIQGDDSNFTGNVVTNGNIAIVGGASVNLVATGNAANAGFIFMVEAGNGDFVRTITSGGGGNVTYTATNEVFLTQIDAGTGNITITADSNGAADFADALTTAQGAIRDNTVLSGDNFVNLIGSNADLDAANGIGAGLAGTGIVGNLEDIDTGLVNLDAFNDVDGHINIEDIADLNLADVGGAADGQAGQGVTQLNDGGIFVVADDNLTVNNQVLILDTGGDNDGDLIYLEARDATAGNVETFLTTNANIDNRDGAAAGVLLLGGGNYAGARGPLTSVDINSSVRSDGFIDIRGSNNIFIDGSSVTTIETRDGGLGIYIRANDGNWGEVVANLTGVNDPVGDPDSPTGLFGTLAINTATNASTGNVAFIADDATDGILWLSGYDVFIKNVATFIIDGQDPDGDIIPQNLGTPLEFGMAITTENDIGTPNDQILAFIDLENGSFVTISDEDTSFGLSNAGFSHFDDGFSDNIRADDRLLFDGGPFDGSADTFGALNINPLTVVASGQDIVNIAPEKIIFFTGIDYIAPGDIIAISTQNSIEVQQNVLMIAGADGLEATSGDLILVADRDITIANGTSLTADHDIIIRAGDGNVPTGPTDGIGTGNAQDSGFITIGGGGVNIRSFDGSVVLEAFGNSDFANGDGRIIIGTGNANNSGPSITAHSDLIVNADSVVEVHGTLRPVIGFLFIQSGSNGMTYPGNVTIGDKGVLKLDNGSLTVGGSAVAGGSGRGELHWSLRHSG